MKRDVPHFRIGLLLTEAGIIAPTQLDEAIRQGEQQGKPFLRVLVGSGYLKQHELQAVIRAQSLIWSGLLDVERAIRALTIVHADDVSIDEGLRCVGWSRPDGTSADTLAGSVQLKMVTAPPAENTNGTACQYCGTALQRGTTICSYCTGENLRASSTKVQVEPAWQRQADSSAGKVVAANPARDPLLMGFLSGCCLAGLGQIVLGQGAKGACLILIGAVLAFFSSGMSSLIVMPLAALDAYLIADKLRNGKVVGIWEFF